MQTLTIRSSRRNEWIDITSQVRDFLAKEGIDNGLCVLYVPHTTAAITVNEGADPSVREDVLHTLCRLVPEAGPYRHAEGNADAHVKASLLGSSVIVPVTHGNLALGTWQSVFFCEFDGPRTRRVELHLVPTLVRGHH